MTTLSSHSQQLPRLSNATINTIAKTLKLYNSIDIAKIYIFCKTNKTVTDNNVVADEVQYVGTYDPSFSSEKEEIEQVEEREIQNLKSIVEKLSTKGDNKLIQFSNQNEGTDTFVNEYIGHFMDKFVIIYLVN